MTNYGCLLLLLLLLVLPLLWCRDKRRVNKRGAARACEPKRSHNLKRPGSSNKQFKRPASATKPERARRPKDEISKRRAAGRRDTSPHEKQSGRVADTRPRVSTQELSEQKEGQEWVQASVGLTLLRWILPVLTDRDKVAVAAAAAAAAEARANQLLHQLRVVVELKYNL